MSTVYGMSTAMAAVNELRPTNHGELGKRTQR